MNTADLPLLSIVTPCYQEQQNVVHQYERVLNAIAAYKDRYRFEHIYTDNCSIDSTFEILHKMAVDNSSIKILRFSRNVGANRAIYQGLIHARGEAAVLIQADLQDPPELISTFIDNWEKGYDVVFGQIKDREETWWLKRLRKIYYYLVSSLAEVQPPRNAGEFRLMSRRVLDSIKLYSEDDIYLRGVIAHIGFKQLAIPYNRAPRLRGQSSTNLIFLIGYGLNGLTSTTVAPLRAVTIIGLLTALIGFILGTYTFIYKLLFPSYLPHGITTLAILIVFFCGLQLLSLGIIGEYIRKIFVQSLNRPQAIIQDKINFDK